MAAMRWPDKPAEPRAAPGMRRIAVTRHVRLDQLAAELADRLGLDREPVLLSQNVRTSGDEYRTVAVWTPDTIPADRAREAIEQHRPR